MAITTGNTSILKPSERDPGATMLLMEMLNEAGCPPGVVVSMEFFSQKFSEINSKILIFPYSERDSW